MRRSEKNSGIFKWEKIYGKICDGITFGRNMTECTVDTPVQKIPVFVRKERYNRNYC